MPAVNAAAACAMVAPGSASSFARGADADQSLVPNLVPMTAFIRNTRLGLPLRNANYGIFTAGNAVSLVGTWMQRITIGWLTWELTHSGFWLGLVAFADFFPVVLVGPFAGAMADRWDRLRVVKISQVVSLLQAAALFVLTAAGYMNVGLLVGLTAFQGFVVAFNQPARLALVPSLVSDSDLGAAVAINSVVFNLARFVGPMLAGAMIVWSGVAMAFAANALSYVVFLVALAYVNVTAAASGPEKQSSFAADLREGLRYTASHPAIGALLMLLIAVGIGGRPLNELLPGFAAVVFQSGAVGFSLLSSAIGAGAIAGGLWLGHRADPARLFSVVVGASFGGAVAAIAVCATSNLWLALPGVVAFGFCISSAGIAAQTMIQVAAHGRMRGRVMGIYGLIFRGAPAIGALAAGILSAPLGLQWPVVLGALVVMAACVWIYTKRAQINGALAAPENKPSA